MQDGSIMKCVINDTETIIDFNSRSRTEGEIISFALDKHHTRALFAISQTDKGSTNFSVFINEVVFPQPKVEVE